MNKIKVKPIEGTDFKEIEVSTKNWNLETRKEIFKLFHKAYKDEGYTTFEAACDVLLLCTNFTEDDIFNLSEEEIEVIAGRLYQEINKKK